MTHESDPPLGPPPRKAHVRRAARNSQRAYATVFLLVIAVFGGWAALDVFHWNEPTVHPVLTVSFGLIALLAGVIYQFVVHPLRRELRLARRGESAQAEIVSVGRRRNRRATPFIAYRFRTAAGAIVEGNCTLPRRFPIDTFAAGASIEVLYDMKKPRLNKPRLALEYVEFTPEQKQNHGESNHGEHGEHGEEFREK
jgi:hypothetical protein